MKKLAKLLWVGLFLMGSVAASAADFSLNPARDFGAIRRIDPTDYDGLAVVRETGAGLSSGTSEAFRNALEVFSKAYVQANYVTTSAANASDALLLRLDGSRAMTGNIRLGGKWLSNDGGNEGLQVSDGGNVLIGTTIDDGTNKLQVNGTAGLADHIIFTADKGIYRGTSDGTDNGYVWLSGGGNYDVARAANASLFGNEYASIGGTVRLSAGNMSTGNIEFYTGNNAERMKIFYDGSIRMASLAGTGSRNVVADAEGDLSAPTSDRRLKKNVSTIHRALDKVKNLRGVYYHWKDTEAKKLGCYGREVGVIAQEVEKVIPEIVGSDIRGMKTVAYDRLVAVLIESTKELNAKVDKQQSEIDELKKLVSKLMKENK